jgi:hypothetical protein
MPKPQKGMFDTEAMPWVKVGGAPDGVMEKILNRDPETGSYTRLLKLEPGIEMPEVLEHDFYEEIYVLEGTIVNRSTNAVTKSGFYCYRHPHMRHGNFKTPDGALLLEIRTYPEKKT